MEEKKCQCCGYIFNDEDDNEDYKNIEEVGECIGCWAMED